MIQIDSVESVARAGAARRQETLLPASDREIERSCAESPRNAYLNVLSMRISGRTATASWIALPVEDAGERRACDRVL